MTDQKVHGQALVKSTYNTSLEPKLKITIEWSLVTNHELLRLFSTLAETQIAPLGI